MARAPRLTISSRPMATGRKSCCSLTWDDPVGQGGPAMCADWSPSPSCTRVRTELDPSDDSGKRGLRRQGSDTNSLPQPSGRNPGRIFLEPSTQTAHRAQRAHLSLTQPHRPHVRTAQGLSAGRHRSHKPPAGPARQVLSCRPVGCLIPSSIAAGWRGATRRGGRSDLGGDGSRFWTSRAAQPMWDADDSACSASVGAGSARQAVLFRLFSDIEEIL
jgi:hypothetical protein